MNYYDIAPLTRISLAKQQAFTYCSDNPLKIGSLVEITFSGIKRRGIVLKKAERPAFQTLQINNVILQKLLTANQLKLATLVAKKYYTSLGVVLKFFVPKISKKKSLYRKVQTAGKKRLQLTGGQKKALQLICKMSNKCFLLFGPASSGKTEILFRLIERSLKKNKQSLVLIPELFLSQQEIRRYQAFFPRQQIAFFHSQCKPSEVRAIYDGIAKGSIKVVISTRMGIFLPFKKLGIAIIDEEQDPSFKQWDQMPFYHVRDVAFLLESVYGCKVIFSSATPSLEILQLAKAKKVRLVRLPMLQTRVINIKKPLIQVLNPAKYYSKKTQVILSSEVKNILKDNLAKNLIALFLVPKRGMGSRVICSDCKLIQSCPNCGTPLVHSKNYYRCFHCSFKRALLSRCSHCSSLRLVDLGIGTEKVSDVLQTHYPDANILTIDASTNFKIGQKNAAFEKIANNEVDFVVGTYAIAKGLDIPKINFAVILDAEMWPGKQEFRHDERWARDLMQFAGRLNRPGSLQNGICLIQSFKPPEKFEFLFKWNWEIFAKKELSSRKELQYPPFGKMVKISYKSLTDKTIDRKVKMVYNQLIADNKLHDIRISEPFIGFAKKKRGKFQKNILINCPGRIPPDLSAKLKKLDHNWTIDIDPEFIF